MEFKTAFMGHKPSRLLCLDPTLTKQSFKDECDINNILKKYQKTGLLDHVNKYQGDYGDYIDAPSYQEAQNRILDAQYMFMSLPATVREKFKNDPGMFLDFVHDPKNEDAMVEMGLAKPKVKPDLVPVTA